MSCHLSGDNKNIKFDDSENVINLALAGNPNVGKSVIFNQLTGLSQTIGNWPGKTVAKKEGYLEFSGFHIKIVDLPGIYSLSTYSLEELISREFLVSSDVDVIVNVIDATNLERNMFLTFQLLELKIPMIVCLNQMDILRKRNIDLDAKKFSELIQLPVIPTVAVHGVGVHQILEEAINLLYSLNGTHLAHKKIKGIVNHRHKSHEKHKRRERHLNHLKSQKRMEYQFPDLTSILSFGKEVESRISDLKLKIKNNDGKILDLNYPNRFLAVKILEGDEELKKVFKTIESAKGIVHTAETYQEELEDLHGEHISTIISSEIYNNINKVLEKIVITKSENLIKKETLLDKLDHLTTHSIWGYVILVLILFGIYYFTFTFGNVVGGLISNVYDSLSINIYQSFGENTFLVKLFWNGTMGGFFGAVDGVLVYVIPFFLVIELLQDSGYLPRAAFLMDRIMHSLGVHGKTIIPMILGFGCNVPACAGCRIMETKREKEISIALTSLIPCAATMTVVLGLVGRYLGFFWIIILFMINLSVIILVGRLLNKAMPGQCTELIMEMHEYRKPNYEVVFKQTWTRSKEFIFKSMPVIVIIGMLMEIMLVFRILDPI
ncbi:MAG: ferrous iron transport protein B [Candidatus Lokiarchaeota archaeon]